MEKNFVKLYCAFLRKCKMSVVNEAGDKGEREENV